MITFKQLEAFYWIAELGTFARAASKLNTTQSAVSKRIGDLEMATGLELFDRTLRAAKLTPKGEHLLAVAQEILSLRERILDLKGAEEIPTRRLKVGITELCAQTWLPRLMAEFRRRHPETSLEPEVDMGRSLYEKLQDHSLDAIVIPEMFTEPNISSVFLARVPNVWMASPDLIPTRHTMTLEQLAEFPVIGQGVRSGSGVYMNRWLRSHGVAFARTVLSDSLVASVGLAVAGIGVTYLPSQCFKPLVDEGKLVVVRTTVPLPSVPYFAMYRNDRPAATIGALVEIAKEVCDFSSLYQYQHDNRPKKS